jgi:hypothetical protein
MDQIQMPRIDRPIPIQFGRVIGLEEIVITPP